MNTAASTRRLLPASAIAFNLAACLFKVPAHAASIRVEGRSPIFFNALIRAGTTGSAPVVFSSRIHKGEIMGPDACQPLCRIGLMRTARRSVEEAPGGTARFDVAETDLIKITDNDAATQSAAAELREFVDHV